MANKGKKRKTKKGVSLSKEIERWSRKSKKKKKQDFKRIALILLIVIILGVLVVGLLPPNYTLEKELHPQVETSKDEQDFIDEIGGYAQENYSTSHVLPSVVIAQAILESDFGRSDLASVYGNLFGRKAYGNEPSVTLSTTEYTNGQYVVVQDRFKVYSSWEDSVIDHGNLMLYGTDWNPNLYQGVRQAKTYREATSALEQAGYATDPGYNDKLNQLIQDYHLTNFDP